MGSKTQIFKDACLVLGITPDIHNADTDDSSVAITLRGAWDTCWQTVIRDHPWGCLKFDDVLSELGVAPISWGFQYAYPADCANARAILQADRTAEPIPFEVALYKDPENSNKLSRVIRTDEAQASLVYTMMIEDPSLWDVQLCKAVAAYLAWMTSSVLTSNKDAANGAWNTYQQAKAEGGTADSNERAPDKERDSDWIRGRN